MEFGITFTKGCFGNCQKKLKIRETVHKH